MVFIALLEHISAWQMIASCHLLTLPTFFFPPVFFFFPFIFLLSLHVLHVSVPISFFSYSVPVSSLSSSLSYSWSSTLIHASFMLIPRFSPDSDCIGNFFPSSPSWPFSKLFHCLLSDLTSVWPWWIWQSQMHFPNILANRMKLPVGPQWGSGIMKNFLLLLKLSYS